VINQNLSKISIDLASRSYSIDIAYNLKPLDVFIGNNNYKKIFIITDSNIANIHLEELLQSLHLLNLSSIIKLVVEPGETSKSFKVFQDLSEEIIANQPDRKSLVIAFGGGVVGDLSGFIASTMLRGIDFIQLPTTLLAMVDSSVGGKTAINSKIGKNLIGTFYQPKMVLCNLSYLKTLPKRQLINGYAEVLKYGLIEDLDFFYWLENNYTNIVESSKYSQANENLSFAVSKSCKIKAKIVVADEKEQNLRAVLNFGHSFAHILEQETGYSNLLLHGEAVAIGISLANRLAYRLKMIESEVVARVDRHLIDVGFVLNPYKIKPEWDIENLKNSIFLDKKNENQKLTFILLENIGKVKIVKNVNFEDFSCVIDDYFKGFLNN
jgi:3-dehydroquinate synthase